MDAVEFVKTVNRLCKLYKNQGCEKCPVYKEGRCMVMCCMVMCKVGFGDDLLNSNSGEYIEEIVSKVEQWVKDHPVKTRQSEFLKMFPNADFCRDVINILPCSIEKEMSKCCDDKKCEECRKDYWLAEMTDND